MRYMHNLAFIFFSSGHCGSGVGFRVSLICVAVGTALFTYRCHITSRRPTVSATGGITVDNGVGFQRTHTQSIDGENADSGSFGKLEYRRKVVFPVNGQGD